jgi:dTDP-4-dehydrorhamnose reductase
MSSAPTILITGCRGQLGMDLMAHLSDNYQVAGISRSEVSITDRTGLIRMFNAVRPDLVIHTAAMTDVDECELNPGMAMAVNADGTENVALACKSVNAKCLYFSTNYVFDGAKKSPYIEGDLINPGTAYGRSKYAGEERITSIIDDYIIVRIGWVYGSYGHNFVKTIIRHGTDQLRAKQEGKVAQTIQVVADQVGNPTWSMDIARQTHAIIQSGLFGLFHVASQGETSWFDFTRLIFEKLQMPVALESCSSEEFAQAANRPAYSALGNSRISEAGIDIMRDYQHAIGDFLQLHRESLCR